MQEKYINQIKKDYYRFSGKHGVNLYSIMFKMRKNHAFMSLFWFRKS
ncbi:hypothetical protein SAMN04487861_11634 [Selenomonas ruminantium]|uniref:Uncharacterized protein n=1 Tax=Selenomonas ruminantium TaxID=971 RepID=A0A1I3FNP1_SELRU|nr:hypothetical protein SAMN04487861_11634 [Selenomonas ruminantium]